MPLFSCSSWFCSGWQSPGAKRQTQEGVAGWPDFDPDFAEEPGLVEPYLISAIRVSPGIRIAGVAWTAPSAVPPLGPDGFGHEPAGPQAP